jgi:Concanavalin A-like lectin/glucanases superfamily
MTTPASVLDAYSEAVIAAAGDYDLSNAAPLKIGFGEFDYFSGKIREVRLYHRALSASEIARLASRGRDFQ